jgi:hypothetical protein
VKRPSEKRTAKKPAPYKPLRLVLLAACFAAPVAIVAYLARPPRKPSPPPPPPPKAAEVPALAPPVPGEGVETRVLRDKARRDMDLLRKAMEAYAADVGELPPRGPYCTPCYVLVEGKRLPLHKPITAEPGPRPPLDDLENALRRKDGEGWNGPYLEGKIPLDPWGRDYLFWDAAPAAEKPRSGFLLSAGPDGLYFTGDEVEMKVTIPPR